MTECNTTSDKIEFRFFEGSEGSYNNDKAPLITIDCFTWKINVKYCVDDGFIHNVPNATQINWKFILESHKIEISIDGSSVWFLDSSNLAKNVTSSCKEKFSNRTFDKIAFTRYDTATKYYNLHG